MPLYLGLDIGGTKSAALVGNELGEVIERVEWLSRATRGPEQMLADLIATGESLCLRHPGIRAIGASIGGPLDAIQGVIYSPPNLPGWDEIPLKPLLKERFDLPVFVEHDAAACAWAEYLWGEPRGEGSLVYLTCGTGFGGGFILNGKIYRGAKGRSPEIGHSRLCASGPVAFGKEGSAESYCAGSSLTRLAAWRYPARWEQSQPSGSELARLANEGDLEAQAIITMNAQAVGQVCANVCDMLAPEVIVLGSLAQHLGESWMATVRAEFEREALPGLRDLCSLRPSSLGKRLQDCSTIAIAMQ